MRINKFVAAATGMSRRAADTVIADGRVLYNGAVPGAGQAVSEPDTVTLDGQPLQLLQRQTILLNKPRGYITSRDGQGAQTIYDLLPPELHHLKPVGRLDKDSSGLLLLTNDGDLAEQLTHPSHHKVKLYEARLDKPLAPLHRQMISDIGIQLEDGPSKLALERLQEGSDTAWRITMHEGRNRQIRRTFAALGYSVTKLHRTTFGSHTLPSAMQPGSYIRLGD
jgi:23S rRNA pseudouridine2605 synthase